MEELISSYLKDLQNIVGQVDSQQIYEIVKILQDAKKNKKQIFMIGNGGSASTANHFTCDFGKNASHSDNERFKIISLCDNISYITAYGNDVGYESVFEEQLKNLMEEGDIVFAISASGNSSNIINAVEFAIEKKGLVISLTGGNGGKLKGLSNVNLNVSSNVIEQVEDLHLIFEHIIVFVFKHM
jgi:D-sedoheptulose 7-phosphate isomerase